ncbi:ABC transporter permease subunit [Luteococcus sp. H138]|uniref:ABC transporter permease subunit n=1 Tax=unclassified Luteococcus TaxID=2639923 RepID=UPI00313DF3BC
MLRLVTAELRRLVRRRLTIVTVLLALIALGLLAFGGWKSTRPMSAEVQAANVQAWKEAQADWEKSKDKQIQQCIDENKVAAKYGNATWECTEANLAPAPYAYGAEPAPVSTLTSGVDMVLGMGLSLVGLLVGASFIAAEFTSRNLGSWLVFEPRRSRVFWAKLLALALGMLALCVITATLYLAGVWAIAQLNHLTPDLTPRMQLSVLYGLGRATILAIAAALGAAGLAFLTRHTSAVLAVCAAWLGFTAIVGGNGDSRAQRFGVVSNIDAWMNGSSSYTVRICQRGTEMNCVYPTRYLDRVDGALLLFGLAALTVLLGWAAFQRRDVS